MPAFTAWQNFYVIVGSSAGALIGLQFVVLALIAENPVPRDLEGANSAFATPTIVHFGAVLLMSAIMSAPWPAIATAAILWGILGLAGLIYVLLVARRMRVQAAYSPQFEDWVFHVFLPFAAYATLTWSAYASGSRIDGALFGIGGASLLLLLVGIHNAWDGVTYHVVSTNRNKVKAKAIAE
ncbi:MAG: hypothetical protein JWO13_671 [Acidobacteriales bacterium]|nr:hypothetical protein [Terriglobales bacterium]